MPAAYVRRRGRRPRAGVESRIANISRVSIVIPIYHDAAALARTLASGDLDGAEILVAATTEDDAALAPLRAAYPAVVWIVAVRGRAAQMNAAAAAATGDWIIFLHGDTRLPAAWRDAIAAAETHGREAGCFRFALDAPGLAARAIAAGVRVRVAIVDLPYGDQALFVRRDVFRALGGYTPLSIMEDVDLVRRLKRRGPIMRSPLPAVTSARRWQRDGWIRRTILNLVLIGMYYAGVDPAILARLDARVRRPSAGDAAT
jgi:rSAM/selenodomain-associated transferase 2